MKGILSIGEIKRTPEISEFNPKISLRYFCYRPKAEVADIFKHDVRNGTVSDHRRVLRHQG